MNPRIELITRLGRFNEIRPQWDGLWRRCGGRIFQAHPWIATWLSRNGTAKPRIAVAWRDDEILAAVPLVIRRRFGLRTLEWAAQVLSDYCDAMATADTVALLPSLWQAACDAGGFVLINLAQVRPDAAMRPIFEGAGADRMRIVGRDDAELCLGIDRVWPDGQAWFRSLGKKGRNNFWRGERILAELGGDVAFRCLDPSERPVDAELRQAMTLKRAWLRTKNPGSSLLGADGEALEAMLCAAAGTGLLRLFVLSCGDRMVAASVNFVTPETMEAYLTCYDFAFSRASPGTILMVNYTRWAFDHAIRQVDFLRGNEPFKSHFANYQVTLTTYQGARTLLGKSLLAAHRWRSRVSDRGHPVPHVVASALGLRTGNLSDLAGET